MLDISLALVQFATKPIVPPGYISPTILNVSFRILMFIIGAIFGSFLCCQARRLRRREEGKKPLGARSVCPYCRHRLKWYENLPLISWCLQRGKCRHCHRAIGHAELLSELLSGLAFVLITSTIDLATITIPGWAIFAATILFAIILIFLAIYDGLYGELPSLLLTFSIICVIMIVVLRYWALFSASRSPWLGSILTTSLIHLGLAVLILGGLYLALYLISKGKWVGDGDWLLGLALGLALGSPLPALITLFVANLLACLISAPGIICRRRSRQIYFGPFLVAAYFITLALCAIIDL